MRGIEAGQKLLARILKNADPDGVAYLPVKDLVKYLQIPYGISGVGDDIKIGGKAVMQNAPLPRTKGGSGDVKRALVSGAKRPMGTAGDNKTVGATVEDIQGFIDDVNEGMMDVQELPKLLSPKQVRRAYDAALYKDIENTWQSNQAFSDAPEKASGVVEPIEVNERYIVDGVRRAMFANDINPNMLVPVRVTRKALTAAEIPTGATSDEKLYARYLMSGLSAESADENRMTLQRVGLRGMLESAEYNDPAWLEFKDRVKDRSSAQTNRAIDKRWDEKAEAKKGLSNTPKRRQMQRSQQTKKRSEERLLNRAELDPSLAEAAVAVLRRRGASEEQINRMLKRAAQPEPGPEVDEVTNSQIDILRKLGLI